MEEGSFGAVAGGLLETAADFPSATMTSNPFLPAASGFTTAPPGKASAMVAASFSSRGRA